MTHPVDTVIVDGVAVSKADLRAFLGRPAILDDPDDAQTFTLSDTRVIFAIQDGANGIGTYIYDAADVTSAHNPAGGVLVSQSGRRYKLFDPSSVLTLTQILSIITDGDLPLAKIADGTANRIIGYGAAGSVGEMNSVAVLAAIDAAVGSSTWRTPATSFQNPVLELSRKTRIGAIAENQNMILMRDGTVMVVGDNVVASSLGPYTADLDRFQLLPQPAGVSFKALFQGDICAFAIDQDDYPWAIGFNTDGQLGVGDTTARTVWTRIPFFFDNTITVQDIKTTIDAATNPRRGTLFLATNGTPYYAGDNLNGQAGNGATADVSTPVQWGSPTFNLTNATLISIGMGIEVGCFVVDSGNLYASGSSASGKLGIGSTGIVNSTPQQVTFANANLITQIEQTRANTFIVLSNGQLWGAGDNADSQLADGTVVDKTSFVQITAVSASVAEVACSPVTNTVSVAAVLTNGNLECWGDNASGCLGLGSTGGDITTPTQPAGTFQGSVERAMFGGGTTKNLYIKAGNVLYSTGENNSETLVQGILDTDSNTFAQVTGVKGTISDWNVQGAAANDDQCLMVLTDEALLTGGANTGGKLGLGTILDMPTLQSVVLPVTFG